MPRIVWPPVKSSRDPRIFCDCHGAALVVTSPTYVIGKMGKACRGVAASSRMLPEKSTGGCKGMHRVATKACSPPSLSSDEGLRRYSIAGGRSSSRTTRSRSEVVSMKQCVASLSASPSQLSIGKRGGVKKKTPQTFSCGAGRVGGKLATTSEFTGIVRTSFDGGAKRLLDYGRFSDGRGLDECVYSQNKGSICLRPLEKAQRLQLHLVSPSSCDGNFTCVVDHHAETMQRLEKEHWRRHRRALYALQQTHPDPWWRLQPVMYYDTRMPEVLALDDHLVMSHVGREIRDVGAQRIFIPDTTV